VLSRSDVTTNQQAVDILLNSADPIGVSGVPLNSWTIHGGLNLHNAMSYGVSTANHAPSANAGLDQSVLDAGGDGTESITLDGSGSSDSDGTIASYEWSEGATVIGTGTSPIVSLTVGAHTITLKVTDDDGADATDTVSVTIRPLVAPTANAGPDQTLTDNDASGSEPVTLNGSASSDADGTIVSYVWRDGATTIGSGVSPSVSLGVGTHTITLQVTDNDGAAATDSVVITVNPFVPPPPTTSHVGDLDASATSNKNAWTARITVLVHNTNHQPVSGALVRGSWSNGASGTSTCTSGAAGTCVIQSANLKKSTNQATFTVTGITAGGLSYTAAQNHDPEADSNGTAITVIKP
jgi:hypothetical protein